MTSTPAIIFRVQVTSAGVLQFSNGTTQLGSDGSTLSTGIWYRLSVAYTITSTSSYELRLFKDGTQDISVSSSTALPTTVSNTLRLGWGSAPGDLLQALEADDIYVDDSNALTDIGDIRVTAKLPNTVNANNFDTTGGTGAVNERSISETNYKQQAGSTQVQQNYTLETASTGDVNISGNTLVARTAWIWAKTGNGAAGTPGIVDNGSVSAVTLTTSPALYTLTTDSVTYPSNAAGIGMRSSGASADNFLYETGTMIAFIGAPVPEYALALAPLALLTPKIFKSLQAGTLTQDILNVLRRVLAILQGFPVFLLKKTKKGLKKVKKVLTKGGENEGG